MRIFRKKVEAAPRPALMRFAAAAGYLRGCSTPGYAALAKDGFVENPIAQRAVRMIAEGAASAKVRVRPAGHPLARLLARPNPVQAGPEFIEAVAAYLSLHGNAFIEVAEAGGEPAELYVLRPERVTIEPGADGWPAAYVYRAGTEAVRYPALKADGRPGLLHIRTFHPLDDHFGLGGLTAAAQAIETHNAASRWNTALLENAARPSGALVYEPGEAGAVLSPEQFERLRAEMDASFAGAANAGRPMLLDGGLRWQAMSLTPAELDFAATKATAAREIALAFGVPPMLLGLPGDNTYANYAEANRALWRLTLLPLIDKVTAALSGHFGAWWPGVEVAIDRESVPALATDRAQLWSLVAGADFLTSEEKRTMLGLGEVAE